MEPSDDIKRLSTHLVTMVTPKDASGYWKLFKDNERYLDIELTKALEDQHRKTWALATEHHVNAIDAVLGSFTSALFKPLSVAAQQAVSGTPCPPIEATKDK